MTKHFQKEIKRLKKRLLALGYLVEKRVKNAYLAVETLDSSIATNIVTSDFEIDELEVELEEECLKLLALYQPVAVDLRYLISIIKINNDLERIGDEAVNIAQKVEVISKRKNELAVFDYSEMANRVQHMLRTSLESVVNLDKTLAYEVCQMDDVVDQIRDVAFSTIQARMKENVDKLEYLVGYMMIARHLERVADHATNIAEDVIYLIDGEIVRHTDMT